MERGRCRNRKICPFDGLCGLKVPTATNLAMEDPLPVRACRFESYPLDYSEAVAEW